MAKRASKKSKSRKRKARKLPSRVELFMGAASAMIVAANFRTGVGVHKDKRRKKARKQEWKRGDP